MCNKNLAKRCMLAVGEIQGANQALSLTGSFTPHSARERGIARSLKIAMRLQRSDVTFVSLSDVTEQSFCHQFLELLKSLKAATAITAIALMTLAASPAFSIVFPIINTVN